MKRQLILLIVLLVGAWVLGACEASEPGLSTILTAQDNTFAAVPSPATPEASLGIRGLTLTPALNQALNLATDQDGVLVEQVEPGSPAANAGLHGSFTEVAVNGSRLLIGGDVIVSLDGKSVISLSQLQNSLQQDQAGRVVTLAILRAGKPLSLRITLGAAPTTTP